MIEKNKTILRINKELEKDNKNYIQMLEIASKVSVKKHLKTVADNNLSFVEAVYKDYLEKRIDKKKLWK